MHAFGFIFNCSDRTSQTFHIIIIYIPVKSGYICGALVINSYVTAIFAETGSRLSEKITSLLIPFVQLTANVIFANIVERFNWKVN